jgi:hypothetical protein
LDLQRILQISKRCKRGDSLTKAHINPERSIRVALDEVNGMPLVVVELFTG